MSALSNAAGITTLALTYAVSTIPTTSALSNAAGITTLALTYAVSTIPTTDALSNAAGLLAVTYALSTRLPATKEASALSNVDKT